MASDSELVASDGVPTTVGEQPREFPKRDYKFWMVFVALAVGNALGALEMSAVSNALPTIVHDLGGGATFIWVGAAYGLCQTILVPFGGGLSEIFGRRPVMLGSLVLMAAGSAVCGAAKNMGTLIAGRVIQGLGAGGSGALTAIIVADLVPLAEFGMFGGLINVSWAIFTAIGPVIAGGLAQSGAWRWLFYLNIPICAIAALLIVLFLKVPTPPGTTSEKLARVDWIGNFIVTGAATATLLGATWGGSPYPWSSYKVLVPLILGLVGLAGFLVYEAKVAKHPVVPYALMTNRTTISGFLQGFIFPMLLTGLLYFAPVYFQACKGTGPTRVGAELLSIVLVVAPFAIIAGASIQATGRFRPQIWIAWALLVLPFGLLTTIKATTSIAPMIVYLVLASIGLGILITTAWYPVIAPLDIKHTPLALSFTAFLRNFAGVWGITIGGAVLQNGLTHRISSDVLASLPGGVNTGAGAGALQYALIPIIPTLAEPTRSTLENAFAGALQEVWKTFAVIAAIGLVVSLGMRKYGLEQMQPPPAAKADVEKQSGSLHDVESK